MRIVHLALTAILLVLLAFPVYAQMDQNQMDQDQMDQEAMNATVQQGPRLRPNLPFSADVLVNGTLAMRIPASAGGRTPMERAETIADRLNQSFAQGLTWQDTQVLQRNGLWTVNLGNNLIATADINSARAFNIQTGQLASRWARQSVIAMGGQPQLIAQQLLPIAVAVAGAQEELGANWSIAPVRSVPVINIANSERVGNITVAGPQNQVSRVNAVALYAYSADGANVWSFVPTTSATFTGVTVPRVAGVGVIRVPASLLEMAGGMATGDDAAQAWSQMSPTQWNSLINSRFSGWRVATTGSTKVVPLYSLTMDQMVGAAQVVGDANAVAATQAVVVSEVNGAMSFSATRTAPSAITGQPPIQNNVVVSSLITFTGDGSAGMPDSVSMDGMDSNP